MKILSSKTPEIRFNGFTDDWEQRKFTEIVDRVKTSSNSNLLPKVEFEDIKAGEGRLNKDIGHKFDTRKGTLFKPNNILFGKLRPYLKNWLLPDFEGIALGDFWVFKPKNSDANFTYYLIQASKYQKVANDTSGTKMPRSDWKQVSTTSFSVPCFEEQIKIGLFFKRLDNTIALHQRQLENLKKSKKAFLQKMFPKNGETVPEVRFEEFSDSWEEHKFGDVWRKSNERNTNLEYKPKDVISVAQMRLKTSQRDSSDEYMKTYNIMYEGDIAFEGNKSKDFSFGRFVLNDIQNGIVSHVFNVYRPKINNDIYFMKIYINNENVMKHILVRSTTKTLMMTTLNPKDIEKQNLILPSIEEQQKIGILFKQLDKTVALHQQQLENLKQTKKAFLQKMFV